MFARGFSLHHRHGVGFRHPDQPASLRWLDLFWFLQHQFAIGGSLPSSAAWLWSSFGTEAAGCTRLSSGIRLTSSLSSRLFIAQPVLLGVVSSLLTAQSSLSDCSPADISDAPVQGVLGAYFSDVIRLPSSSS